MAVVSEGFRVVPSLELASAVCCHVPRLLLRTAGA
jgi:hypothetical protein